MGRPLKIRRCSRTLFLKAEIETRPLFVPCSFLSQTTPGWHIPNGCTASGSCGASQSRKAVSAYFTSQQILLSGFARRNSPGLCSLVGICDQNISQWTVVRLQSTGIKETDGNSADAMLFRLLKRWIILCINHGDQMFFSIWKKINFLATVAVSCAFEYLCSGSTAIKNVFAILVRRLTLDVKIWRLQTSDSDV